MAERVAYINGEILPESQVTVSFRDRGFIFGDGLYDTARTVAHAPFLFEEHIERLYRTLAYLQIDCGLTPAEMLAITRDVVDRNLPLLGPSEDYWVTQRISRGANRPDQGWTGRTTPTVIVECTPLPLAQRATMFRDGADLAVSAVRRIPPESLSPRAKTANYLNLVMADLEVQATRPGAWAITLDVNGNLCEGLGSNLFLVRNGTVFTPRAQMVLPGLSRHMVMEIAEDRGIPLIETDLDLYDAYAADEGFITSTSLCLCPARGIDGRPFRAGGVPGPITAALIDGYRDRLGGFDFVGQYLAHLPNAA